MHGSKLSLAVWLGAISDGVLVYLELYQRNLILAHLMIEKPSSGAAQLVTWS